MAAYSASKTRLESGACSALVCGNTCTSISCQEKGEGGDEQRAGLEQQGRCCVVSRPAGRLAGRQTSAARAKMSTSCLDGAVVFSSAMPDNMQTR